MIELIAAVAVMVQRPSSSQAVEPVFQLPRRLAEVSQLEGAVGRTSVKDDFGKYVRNLQKIVATGGTPVPAPRGMSINIPRGDLRALLDRLFNGRQILAPDEELSTHLVGFNQTMYRFALDGRIAFVKLPLAEITESRGTYEVLRGYWKTFDRDKQVFFGVGVRVPFRISGFRFFNWDALSSYKVTSDLLDEKKVPVRNQLVLQQYGNVEPVVYLPSIRAARHAVALERLATLVNETFERKFKEIEGVEPIDLRLPQQDALDFVKELDTSGATSK